MGVALASANSHNSEWQKKKWQRVWNIFVKNRKNQLTIEAPIGCASACVCECVCGQLFEINMQRFLVTFLLSVIES